MAGMKCDECCTNNNDEPKRSKIECLIPGIKQSQADIVIRTWEIVEQDPLKHGAVFYNKLFNDYPEVKPMFTFASKVKNDEDFSKNASIMGQAKKLTKMISFAVHALDKPEKFMKKLKRSGELHFVKWHVEERHFPIVGECLLYTLKQGLGDLFTEETHNAWAHVYSLMAKVMIEAGKEATQKGDGHPV